MDMLLGLDMLRRFQASIDLGKNALVIQGRSLRFLNEHELPAHARLLQSGTDNPVQQNNPTKSTSTSLTPDASNSSWPAESINALTNLGMSPEKAIELLNKTSGNENIAASIYFQ